MKTYTLMHGAEVVVDENDSPVSFKASKEENIYRWIYQKAFELNNNSDKGPYWVKVTE